MLKTTASSVLASLNASTYNEELRLGISFVAALLDGPFEHHAETRASGNTKKPWAVGPITRWQAKSGVDYSARLI
jgi:hypothetical protein